MSELNNPWIYLPTKSPYVLSSDVNIINQFNNNTHDNYRIQLDALPEPYFGNKDALVVLLGLNPGFDDKDPEVHADFEFQALLRNNYLHKSVDYPFYFLHPEFQNPGRDWWEKKLKPLMSLFPRNILANALFCVEYFPYHSRKFRHANLKLPTQEYGFSMARAAMERNAVIVMMRAKTLWFDVIPALKTYPLLQTLNSPQNVVISPRNCHGFDAIVSAIKEYSKKY